MLQIGIMLAVGSALLCGLADVCASQSAKRVGAEKATFLALLTGTFVLALIGVLAVGRLGLSGRALLLSLPLGLVTGALTAIGYCAGYKAMALGPLAIVSPIISVDGAIAGVLAILLLHEQVDAWQVAILLAIFAGVLLAGTSVKDLSLLLRARKRNLFGTRGVHWGLLAALAFGAMLFALSAGTQVWGCYLSLFWSRCIATCILGVTVGRQWFRGGGKHHTAAPELLTGGRNLLAGSFLAFGGGIGETAGLLCFSIATQFAATSLVAVIATTFTLIPMVFGVLRLCERPTSSQWCGIGLVVAGIVLLASKPA